MFLELKTLISPSLHRKVFWNSHLQWVAPLTFLPQLALGFSLFCHSTKLPAKTTDSLLVAKHSQWWVFHSPLTWRLGGIWPSWLLPVLWDSFLTWIGFHDVSFSRVVILHLWWPLLSLIWGMFILHLSLDVGLLEGSFSSSLVFFTLWSSGEILFKALLTTFKPALPSGLPPF